MDGSGIIDESLDRCVLPLRQELLDQRQLWVQGMGAGDEWLATALADSRRAALVNAIPSTGPVAHHAQEQPLPAIMPLPPLNRSPVQ